MPLQRGTPHPLQPSPFCLPITAFCSQEPHFPHPSIALTLPSGHPYWPPPLRLYPTTRKNLTQKFSLSIPLTTSFQMSTFTFGKRMKLKLRPPPNHSWEFPGWTCSPPHIDLSSPLQLACCYKHTFLSTPPMENS